MEEIENFTDQSSFLTKYAVTPFFSVEEHIYNLEYQKFKKRHFRLNFPELNLKKKLNNYSTNQLNIYIKTKLQELKIMRNPPIAQNRQFRPTSRSHKQRKLDRAIQMITEGKHSDNKISQKCGISTTKIKDMTFYLERGINPLWELRKHHPPQIDHFFDIQKNSKKGLRMLKADPFTENDSKVSRKYIQSD